MKHKFVDSVPPVTQMEQGTLYVSIKYNSAIHLCACGCGSEIVTPLSPVGWRLIYNGRSVSLRPSIGNWNYPCRSHYYITEDEIVWAGRFTDKQIKEVQLADKMATDDLCETDTPIKPVHKASFFEWLKSFWR